MPAALIIPAVTFLAIGAFLLWLRQRGAALTREHIIRTYVFPRAVLQELTKTYPHLEPKDVQLAARALRQFFLIHARAGNRVIAMPSKVVDALWHAFILDTRAYAAFCKAAFGAYFHHIPEGAMARERDEEVPWRTWRLACLEENINPGRATRLPLLYAIDAKLGIPGAAKYDPAAFKAPKGSSCGGGSGSCGGDGGCGGGCGG